MNSAVLEYIHTYIYVGCNLSYKAVRVLMMQTVSQCESWVSLTKFSYHHYLSQYTWEYESSKHIVVRQKAVCLKEDWNNCTMYWWTGSPFEHRLHGSVTNIFLPSLPGSHKLYPFIRFHVRTFQHVQSSLLNILHVPPIWSSMIWSS